MSSKTDEIIDNLIVNSFLLAFIYYELMIRLFIIFLK
jgi:hypothetical protein